MIDLSFAVLEAYAQPHTLAPELRLKVAVSQAGPAVVLSGQLTCEVRIDPTSRPHSPEERLSLFELFGAPEQWSRSLRSLLWARPQVTLPAFSERVEVEVSLPCSFDFNLGATKYLDAVEDKVPLRLLFSGTLFYRQDEGPLQIYPVPWSQEAEFALEVELWRELVGRHYQNQAFLGLRKDVFDRLRAFKAARAIPTWDQALEQLLSEVQA